MLTGFTSGEDQAENSRGKAALMTTGIALLTVLEEEGVPLGGRLIEFR